MELTRITIPYAEIAQGQRQRALYSRAITSSKDRAPRDKQQDQFKDRERAENEPAASEQQAEGLPGGTQVNQDTLNIIA